MTMHTNIYNYNILGVLYIQDVFIYSYYTSGVYIYPWYD